MRSYAFGLLRGGKAGLLKNCGKYEILIRKDFFWELRKEYRLVIKVKGKDIRVEIDGILAVSYTHLVSCFCVIAGRIRNMDKVLSRYEQKGMELFYSSLNSILEQALQRYREYDVIQYTMDTIGIFISFSDTSSTQEIHLRIRRLVPHIHSIVQNYLDLDMIFGISSFQFGEKEIKKAWEQAGQMCIRDRPYTI